MTFAYLWLYIYGKDKISMSTLTFSRTGISKKNNYLTLTVDIERQGQTHFYMTFLIHVCIHDTDIISIGISILTKSKSVISNKPKIIT